MKPERYARVQELFWQACDLDEANRRTFLQEQCGDDVVLRAMVESLLQHDDPGTLIRANDTVGNFESGTVVPSQPQRRRNPISFSRLKTPRLDPRGHLALGICIACLLVAVVGLFVSRNLRELRKTMQANYLQEILDAKTSSLEMWLDHEKRKIESWARSTELQRLVLQLVQLAERTEVDWDEVRESPLQSATAAELRRLAGGTIDYAIWDDRYMTIADSLSAGKLVGAGVTPFGASYLADVFADRSHVLLYGPNRTIEKRNPGDTVESQFSVMAPIKDSQGRSVAALRAHIPNAQEQAGTILRMVRIGGSGETYAFSREGAMLSPSRYADQLREVGLLPAVDEESLGIGLLLRDPGGDLTAGYRPKESLATRPLTKMARHAITGEDGVDVAGYRDYRGVMVIGAWRWLEPYEIGLATELDLRESEPGRWMAELATWILFGLFSASLALIVVSNYSIRKLRWQIGEQSRLGQYVLERQVGEGGMGKVFRARHAFLKRPMAIKLLKPEMGDTASIARFEREANLASQLTHPNTVEVFDFGVTPEGTFYFVMEFIDGPSISELVQRFGPLDPPRAVALLRQVCESLREAHGQGMIHRDLKPQNIMVCRRGGQADVVKVLDFGLVKRINRSEDQTVTAVLAGTPRYIAPERWHDPSLVSPRTDIYALGAVAFFLLTGREVFGGTDLADIMVQTLQDDPPRPAEIRSVIPAVLDQLVVDCLAKDPAHRPQQITEVLDVLTNLALSHPWEPAMAERWWKEHMSADDASLE